MVKNKYLAVIAAASILSFTLPSLAYQSCSGPYLGAQMGYGKTHYGFSESSKVSEDGVAGRVYFGYQFNPYVGLEMGASIFSDVDLPRGIGSLSTTQVDILAKLGTPFGNSNIRGDIKGGLAAIRTDFNAGRHTLYDDDDNTETKPVLGASLSANVTRQLSVDVSYLHGFGNPKDEKESAPRTDLLTLGLSYQFVY